MAVDLDVNPNPRGVGEYGVTFNGNIINAQRTLNGPNGHPTGPTDIPTVIGPFQRLFTIALSIVQNWDVRNADNRVNSLDVNEFR